MDFIVGTYKRLSCVENLRVLEQILNKAVKKKNDLYRHSLNFNVFINNNNIWTLHHLIHHEKFNEFI